MVSFQMLKKEVKERISCQYYFKERYLTALIPYSTLPLPLL
jgi:hypothetical protein